MVEFLRNAVVGRPSSNEPLSRVATHQLTFQQLYSELEAAVQLHKGSKLAILRDRAQLRRRTLPEDDSAGIMCAGQGRYYHGTAPSHLGKARKPCVPSSVPRGTGVKPAQRGQFDPLSISGCFNCGGNHLVKDCNLQLNTSRAAARKMDYYSKKANTKPIAVHHVLANLCQQLDCTRTDDPDEEIECNDVSIFERIPGQESPELEVEPEGEGTPSYSDEHTNHVYVTRKTCGIPSLDFLQGVCIDSAAQKSVIGAAQAKGVLQLIRHPFPAL